MSLLMSLLTWHAQGLAPDDFNIECRTGDNAALHMLPEDWVLLLDSFDYNDLVGGSDPVWQSIDFDNDGNQVIAT